MDLFDMATTSLSNALGSVASSIENNYLGVDVQHEMYKNQMMNSWQQQQQHEQLMRRLRG